MTTATMTAFFADASARKGFFARFLDSFAAAKNFERMYALSDEQLAARGFTRDAIVRSYINDLDANT